MIGAAWARCKGCGLQRQIAGDVAGRPVLSLLFAALDVLELTSAGWTRDAGAWWCRHCTRRRNLMRPVRGGKSSNVTDPPPPSGEKM